MNKCAKVRENYFCRFADRIAVPEETLTGVENLYNVGSYLDAYRLALSIGPLHRWRGTPARVLGSRLAARLGGHKLSSILAATSWRETPRAAPAVLYRVYHLFLTKGPLSVWEFTEDWKSLDGLTEIVAADFLALRARVAGIYRDFELAWRLMDQALERAPDSPWLWCERAALLATEERLEEARLSCDKSLQIRPWFHPTVQVQAHLLQRERRMSDADTWLEDASKHLQSAEVIAQRIGIRREQDDYEGMAALLDAFEVHTPLLEQAGRKWLAGLRCDVHCLAGEWELAAKQAEIEGGEYYLALAAKLRGANLGVRRVRLSPPHVIQKHRTCGPATLAMLAGFWNHPATQDLITDAICYDGTYDHTERQWCLDNVLAAREFCITWEAGCALLDAGLPFAMATVEVNSAHLQAVVGYDAVRKTFLVQDPSSFLFREAVVDKLFKEYALHGPRGMVIVPEAKKHLIDSIQLPEAELYDLFFAFNRALHELKRDRAEEICQQMAEQAPNHRLYWQMRWGLSRFDNDVESEQEATQALEIQFPENPRLLTRRVRVLRENGRKEKLIAILRDAAKVKKAHPLIWRDLAVELANDARMDKEAWKWLRRAHAALPLDPDIIEAWGDRWWRNNQRERAVDAFGFAASWVSTDERRARLWFDSERLIGRRSEALDRLKARHRLLGAKSAQPARTLIRALDEVSNDAEAESVLKNALDQHPQDGPLLLDAVRFSASDGDFNAASTYLSAAATLTPRSIWLRVRADLHDKLSEYREALSTWQELAQREPMSVDVHTATARLLSILEGDAAARDHLDGAVGRFPHHFGLQRLRLEWLRAFSLPLAEEAARRLLAIYPSNALAMRELAALLGAQGRHQEALTAAQTAFELEPSNPAGHGILARAMEDLGLIEEARSHYRLSLTMNVDYTFAIRQLIGCAASGSQKRADLTFIRDEMIRQVLEGSCLFTYRELAFPLLEPNNLLEQLEEVHKARPDLYAAWSVLTKQLLDMGKWNEACELATEATKRFARIPGAWLNAAHVHRAKSDWSKALTCAGTAVELNPNWPDGWLAWASYLEDSGDPEKAVNLLERAVWRLPNASNLHVLLASMLWRLGRREEAFGRIITSASRFPSELTAWELAEKWANTLGKTETLIAAVRRLTQDRPGEARCWMILARALPRMAMDEKLAALDRAIMLKPRLTEAYDLKAFLLATQGRFVEAEAACQPEVFRDAQPFDLEGRAAWLMAVQGKIKEALECMEKILVLQPDYFWGWQQVLNFASELKDAQKVEKARAALARLAPNDARVLCELADGELKAGRGEEAAQLYRRAVAISPDAPYPLSQWLRLCWKSRDATTIKHIAQSALPGLTRSIADVFLVLVAVYEGQESDAQQELARVICTTEPIGSVVPDLFEGLKSLDWESHLADALDAAACQKTIGMAFTPYWVERKLQEGEWSIWNHFSDWIARGHEDAADAILTYFDIVGKEKISYSAEGFFASSVAPWVRQRTKLFGKVGWALAHAGRWEKTAVWLQGAEKRDDAEGWWCFNLILALVNTGRRGEATDVARRVVSRELRDDTWPMIVAQLAYGAAIDGKIEEAQATLSKGEMPKEFGFWSWEYVLAQELVKVLTADKSTAKRDQKIAINSLRALAFENSNKVTNIMAQMHHDALQHMSRHSGAILWPWDFFIGDTFLKVHFGLKRAGQRTLILLRQIIHFW